MEDASSLEPTPAEKFMHKNRLQQYAQRSALPLPVYQTFSKGSPHAPQFQSTVIVDGETFSSSKSFFSRKEAEQDVAKVALEGISRKIEQEGFPLIHADTTFCKSVLHEYAAKMKLEKPMYTCSQLKGLIPTFISYVSFAGKVYKGISGRNKKEAQQLGAREIIKSILADCDSSARTVMSQIIKAKGKFFAAINHSSMSESSPVMNPLPEGNPENLSKNCLVGSKNVQSASTNGRHDVNICSTMMLLATNDNTDNPLGRSLVKCEELQPAMTNERPIVAEHVVALPSTQISEACLACVEGMKPKEHMQEIYLGLTGGGTSLGRQVHDGSHAAVSLSPTYCSHGDPSSLSAFPQVGLPGFFSGTQEMSPSSKRKRSRKGKGEHKSKKSKKSRKSKRSKGSRAGGVACL